MAVQHFYINENIYYEYYQNHINCLIIDKSECNKSEIKTYDTAVLHCTYNNGDIDKGRYLSPVYKTITCLLDTYAMPGLNNDSVLICFR